MFVYEIKSFKELQTRLGKEKRSFLLIYKKGSVQSDRAFDNLGAASEEANDIGIFTTDVSFVRDIHV